MMPLNQGQVFEVLGSPFLQPAGYRSSRFLQLILKPFSLTPPRIHSPLQAIMSFLNIACSSHPNSTCHPAYEHTQPHMPNTPMHPGDWSSASPFQKLPLPGGHLQVSPPWHSRTVALAPFGSSPEAGLSAICPSRSVDVCCPLSDPWCQQQSSSVCIAAGSLGSAVNLARFKYRLHNYPL